MIIIVSLNGKINRQTKKNVSSDEALLIEPKNFPLRNPLVDWTGDAVFISSFLLIVSFVFDHYDDYLFIHLLLDTRSS